MNILNLIDKDYRNNCNKLNISVPNNYYYLYHDIEAIGFECSKTVSFKLRKNKKTHIFILKNDTINDATMYIYLSDNDIINTIKQNKNILNFFRNACLNLQKNTNDRNFSFKVLSKTIHSHGIPYSNNNDTIELHNGISILLNEFIFVINFILYKDSLYKKTETLLDKLKKI